jgi:hypothetical protein
VLKLEIRGKELFDEERSAFIPGPIIATLELEHSLVSISKWESFWEIPFMGKLEKTNEQVLWYVRAMILNENYDPEVLTLLNEDHVKAINAYIDKKHTATTINDDGGKPNREIITSELIYYWMIALNIPMECQYWHLNRLLTLIQVTNIKNQPADSKPKMSAAELAAHNRKLNAERRAKYGTSG